MARFRGTMTGNRGQVSRLGTAKSGIMAHVDGWNSGVSVQATLNKEGQDTFFIYATGGSNSRQKVEYIGQLVDTENGYKYIPGSIQPA